MSNLNRTWSFTETLFFKKNINSPVLKAFLNSYNFVSVDFNIFFFAKILTAPVDKSYLRSFKVCHAEKALLTTSEKNKVLSKI